MSDVQIIINFIGLVLICCGRCCCQFVDTQSHMTSINDKIRKHIENIQQEMPCGLANLPSLVPLKISNIDIDINNDEIQ